MADVPLMVVSENASSERRITPSWTITQLRAKLEPITGIPPSCQKLSIQVPGSAPVSVEASDEDSTYLSNFPLRAYAELSVIDTRPPNARPNLSDTTGVEKYVMPEDEYEKKSDSVLAWKKAQQLGRFDPSAPSQEAARLSAFEQDIQQRGIEAGKRCRVGADDTRRGTVCFVGEVKQIPNGAGAWVGVMLDEPVGKNDGSIAGVRYFGEQSDLKHGVFVRPERVEIGEYPVMNDLEDMEEI
ncbi:tubulin specific chaperone cofactor B [Sarocladium strictum]